MKTHLIYRTEDCLLIDALLGTFEIMDKLNRCNIPSHNLPNGMVKVSHQIEGIRDVENAILDALGFVGANYEINQLDNKICILESEPSDRKFIR